MAKQTKGGLGRGLGALLGEEYQDLTGNSANKDSQVKQVAEETKEVPERIRVEVGEIDEYDPIIEPKHEPKHVMTDQEIEDAVVLEREVTAVKPSPETKTQVKVNSVQTKPVIIADKELDENSLIVPIKEVKPNPDQPRTQFKKEEIEELANSIEKDGLLQPILVRRVNDHEYQIIAGERRWQASKKAGLQNIPIRVKDVDEGKALELALIENIQRSDLNPIEEAYAYKRLMDHQNMTQSDVARAVSKGRSTIANALRLLDLPEDAQQLLFEEKITAGHARAILSIPTEEGKNKLTAKLVEEKISVRDAESLARLYSGLGNKDDQPKRQPLPASYKKVAKLLRETLKTNVRIKNVKGKNKIEIEFKDEEDLTRLLEELTGE